MGNLVLTPAFGANVIQLEINTPAQGGPSGIANAQAQELGNRTEWLKDNLDPLIGKLFFSLNYAGSVVVASPGNSWADGTAYSFAYPVPSPDFTTPNDGITRTYKITTSGFCDFTLGASGNVRMCVITTNPGPSLVYVTNVRFRYPYNKFCLTQVVTLGPNVRIKSLIDTNNIGSSATFSEMQLIVEEV